MFRLFRFLLFALAVLFAMTGAHATQWIWGSGSSSVTRSVYNAFVSNCTAAGHTIYMSGDLASADIYDELKYRPGDSDTGDYFMYSCTIDGTKTATFNTWDGQVVNFYHTVAGGSFVAFQPHLPVPTPTKRINDAVENYCWPYTCPSSCTLVGTSGGVTIYKSCPTTTAFNSLRPDGGFSDVEDELWPTLNQGTNFVHKPANVAQLFGVAATLELYKAMQDKQKADGRMDLACVTGDFTPGPCQPTISSAEYRSLVSTSALGNYHVDWTAIVGAAGTGKVVRVCRRVDTSGTQASSNAYFLENPCRQWNMQIGQLLPSTSASAEQEVIDNGFLYDVVENSGTGDVKSCLTNSNNLVSKTVASNPPAGNYTSDATTTFAIGVLSMENYPGASDKFKYLKLDNVSPNLDYKQRAAGAKGHYSFVMEMVYWGVPTSGIGSGSKASTFNPVVNTEPFFTELAKDMASTTILDLTGLYISPAGGATPDGDKVGYGSKGGKNCQPVELF